MLSDQLPATDIHCGDCMFIGSEGGRYCAALDGRQLRGDGHGPLRPAQCIELDLKMVKFHEETGD